MESITAIFAAKAAGGAAAGSTVGAAGGGAAAGASAFSAGNFISGIGTVFSMATSIMQGKQEAAALNIQARTAEIDARREEVKGAQESANIREALAASLAAKVAARGTGSVAISSGSAALDITSGTIKARHELDVVQSNAEISSLSSKATAASRRIAAYRAKQTGKLKAVGSLIKFGEGIAKQGIGA